MSRDGQILPVPEDVLLDLAQDLDVLIGMLLFEHGRYNLGTRDVLIRNFMARVAMLLRGVVSLWRLKDYQDCWVLFRCLLDRLFLLHHLDECNEFEAFEAWSFFEEFQAIHGLRGDKEFSSRVDLIQIAPSREQRERAKKLLKNPPQWIRPKAEDTAKKMGMKFLYKFGYDYGSRHVHPMASDGHQDFFTITKVEPSPPFQNYREVLSNSLLVAIMFVQNGLNASSREGYGVAMYEELPFFAPYFEHLTIADARDPAGCKGYPDCGTCDCTASRRSPAAPLDGLARPGYARRSEAERGVRSIAEDPPAGDGGEDVLHHIEICVGDLDRSIEFWTPFLARLGYEAERWSGGLNYVKEGHPYLCFLPAPAEHLAAGYHRKRVGLNHLAFQGESRQQVDEMAAWVKSAGYTLLYADRHPFAGGPGYYALFCEDPDRIKVEVVAPGER